MICCSGSDICQLVKAANMYPVRKITRAKYFTQIPIEGKCLESDSCQLWHPCHERAAGARQKSYQSLKGKDICTPSVTFPDLLMALKRLPRTVDPTILKDLKDFCKIHGILFKEPNITYAKSKEKDIILNTSHQAPHNRSERILPSVLEQALNVAVSR